ncbi:MAG: cytochrome P450, partial [Actinomycetes bacterium]
AVVDESLRLFPPAWVLSRRVVRGDVLDGVPVPPGTLVILSPWLLQRRGGAFPEPEAFLPERWLEPGTDALARSQRGEYLPFGLGPRLCIGRDVALVELVLLLAELLRDHAVASVPGTTVEVEALVTLRPRAGIPLRLTDRHP